MFNTFLSCNYSLLEYFLFRFCSIWAVMHLLRSMLQCVNPLCLEIFINDRILPESSKFTLGLSATRWAISDRGYHRLVEMLINWWQNSIWSVIALKCYDSTDFSDVRCSSCHSWSGQHLSLRWIIHTEFIVLLSFCNKSNKTGVDLEYRISGIIFMTEFFEIVAFH